MKRPIIPGDRMVEQAKESAVYDSCQDGVIRFTVPGIPVPKARARHALIHGHVRSWTPKTTATFENLIRLAGAEAMQKNCVGALNGPLRLEAVFWFPFPEWSRKLGPKSKKKLHEAQAHSQRPDLDNLCKCILDGLQGVAFRNDDQVSEIELRKRWSDSGRTDILVSQIDVGSI